MLMPYASAFYPPSQGSGQNRLLALFAESGMFNNDQSSIRLLVNALIGVIWPRWLLGTNIKAVLSY